MDHWLWTPDLFQKFQNTIFFKISKIPFMEELKPYQKFFQIFFMLSFEKKMLKKTDFDLNFGLNFDLNFEFLLTVWGPNNCLGVVKNPKNCNCPPPFNRHGRVMRVMFLIGNVSSEVISYPGCNLLVEVWDRSDPICSFNLRSW